MDPFSLDGKTALLTGATAGIGKRMATVLHKAGAQVALVGRRREILEQLVIDLPGCAEVTADLEFDDPAEIHARAVSKLGPIDILVNNAATIAGGVRAEDETAEDILRTLRVNLIAPIGFAQAVYPAMRARGGGSIVNITSIVAHVGIGRFPQATYAATKGGLLAITREWAAQWSRYGVRVNAISPGFIETEITQDVINQEKIQNWILRNTMIPRHGQPSDFDGALLFLASEASAYVTGQSIIVDGGWTAH